MHIQPRVQFPGQTFPQRQPTGRRMAGAVSASVLCSSLLGLDAARGPEETGRVFE